MTCFRIIFNSMDVRMTTDRKITPTHLSGWWISKVVCSILLSTHLVLHFTGRLAAAWIEIPLFVSQGIVLLGAAIFLIHYLMIKKANPDISMPALLISQRGLFILIRHPMYFGEIILNVGLASFAINPFSLIVLLTGIVSIYRQSLVEDLAMEQRFGAEYSTWKSKSKLLLPSIR